MIDAAPAAIVEDELHLLPDPRALVTVRPSVSGTSLRRSGSQPAPAGRTQRNITQSRARREGIARKDSGAAAIQPVTRPPTSVGGLGQWIVGGGVAPAGSNPSHTTVGLRAITSTSAPCSPSSAADSSAL